MLLHHICHIGDCIDHPMGSVQGKACNVVLLHAPYAKICEYVSIVARLNDGQP